MLCMIVRFLVGGSNENSQTNVPDTLENPSSVVAGDLNTCAIDNLGIVCWGDNEDGQSDVPDELYNF